MPIRIDDKPIRVLHLAPTVSASDGTSLAVLAMLRALRQQADIEAQLLTGEYAGLALHPALPRDASVRILPVLQPLDGRLGYTVGHPPRFKRTLSELASSADLVHVHGLWLYPTILGCPILRRLPRPYVLSLHGALMTDAMARSRIKKMLALAMFERRNIETANAVVTTSMTELDQLRSFRFLVRGTVVPLAVDPAAMAFFARPPTLDTTTTRPERTLLCVSRFHSRKRLVEVVRAFAKAGQQFPQWRLRIVGPDYEHGYRDKIVAAVRASGLAGRISVEQALGGERLWRAYRDADLFLLASTFENFGLVIAEALAAGLPVIATRGTPWPQLERQRCGWWIEPSLEALDSTLKDAMSTPRAALREMGQRGARLVEADFSLRALGTGLSALYHSVLDGRSASAGR
jgi:glycosyltransferase involved in cell wall biosynthesis